MYMRDRQLTSARTGECPLHSHARVVAAATDPETFSSDVSRFLQIPNGLDGAEHACWRALIERFMSADAVHELRPRVRRIARELIAALDTSEPIELVGELGAVFAVRAQLAWLGWDPALEPELLAWIGEHDAAVTAGDRARIAAAAQRFDELVQTQIDARRAWPHYFDGDDVTVQLAGSQHEDGSRLTDEQIVSILRNWTAGDLGSLAASFGVIMHAVATEPAVAAALRDAAARDAAPELDRAIDELLRRDDPFLSNRRITTRDVDELAAGSVVSLRWVDANRDPAVFAEPDAFRPREHAADNLVWGIGPHACPGRALATMELRELLVAALLATCSITIDEQLTPQRAAGVRLGGYRTVHARLTPVSTGS